MDARAAPRRGSVPAAGGREAARAWPAHRTRQHGERRSADGGKARPRSSTSAPRRPPMSRSPSACSRRPAFRTCCSTDACKDTPRLLRELGRAIGVPAEGESLARVRRCVAARRSPRASRRSPRSKRPRVFYARGPNGLATAPRGSLQAEVFDLAGARNVAEPPPGFPGQSRSTSRSSRCCLAARRDRDDRSRVRARRAPRPEWQGVPAVKNNRIYVAPELPFGWVDAPPALNRILGLEWLVRILHPTVFPEPLGPRIVEFHRALLSPRADGRAGGGAAGAGRASARERSADTAALTSRRGRGGRRAHACARARRA